MCLPMCSELPRTFFGDFDKQERRLVDANTNIGVPAKVLSLDTLAEHGFIPNKKFNRPRGCDATQVVCSIV